MCKCNIHYIYVLYAFMKVKQEQRERVTNVARLYCTGFTEIFHCMV